MIQIGVEQLRNKRILFLLSLLYIYITIRFYFYN